MPFLHQTVVLVTHSIQHLPAATQVIVLTSGSVSHQGTYDEVRSAGAPFATAVQDVAKSVEPSAAQSKKKESTGSGAMTPVRARKKQEDEELSWQSTSKFGAYAFLWSCAGTGKASAFAGPFSCYSSRLRN